MKVNEQISNLTEEYQGYYNLPRLPLLNLVTTPKKNILEIGCGEGANLYALKQRFPDCNTVGLELRETAANAARLKGRIDRIIQGDILKCPPDQFEAGHFDLIILSHVLEHFINPEDIIIKAKHWLQADGEILIALPNIRHLSILHQLIWYGDFKYENSGILDHTHLRFYTKKSALRFFRDMDLTVIKHNYDINGRKSSLINLLTLGTGKDFAAFAHNFLLKKRS